MKYYTITVNGNTYEVSVEETQGPSQSSESIKTPIKTVATPAKPVAAKAPTAVSQGGIKVNSPMPGKILAVKANAGNAVKKGDVILILEAMKMENEIVAPQEGTIASIHVTVGQTVEAGDLLITLN